ncbi:hypothetical protein ARSQ2_01768 [Arsenophonus endosymbiont of Bemisia tabaci Q2]|nr:hypothetical protein ARSQ2_01768 [Arsenophonus endosymbiont of Bemisia tabaci Q2]
MLLNSIKRSDSNHQRTISFLVKGILLLCIAKRLNFDDIIYMSYSIDFKRKVIFTMEEEGLSIRETAKQFRIGCVSVSRWINQIEPKASTTRQRKIDKSELI